MPADISLIPALEEELRQARGTKPGGQESRPERVAAIEGELSLLRKEAERQFKAVREAAGVTTKREKPVKGSKETADAEPAPSDADEKSARRAEDADATSDDLETRTTE